jgi:pyruvate carboxylase
MADNKDIKITEFLFEGARYKTTLPDSFTNRKKWEPDNPYMLTSVIPGTIVKINVKEGQKVNKGRVLFVLEAMKMKNKIMSTVSGQVKKIHIEEGQKVSKNQLVMEFTSL